MCKQPSQPRLVAAPRIRVAANNATPEEQTLKRNLIGSAVAVGATTVALLAGPAGAQTDHFKIHDTVEVAGDVFTCTGGDITVTGGTITEAIEGNTDAQGIFHITGTVVPHNVTGVDAAGNVYMISGAGWFGGKSSGDPDNGGQLLVLTDTEHFVLRSASGGVYAKVQAVLHISSNGNVVSFDLGTCEPPAG